MLLFFLLFSACSETGLNDIQVDKVLITAGGWGGIPYVFEVRKNGLLEVTVGDNIEDTFFNSMDENNQVSYGYNKPKKRKKIIFE